MTKKLTDLKLRDGYVQMASDRAREREARQWSEGVMTFHPKIQLQL